MTSSNGNNSALLALCAGNSSVIGEFPSQRPVTRSFGVFFDLCLDKGWVNNREAGDLRRYRANYDVTVMLCAVYKTSYIMSLYPSMAPRRVATSYSWPQFHGLVKERCNPSASARELRLSGTNPSNWSNSQIAWCTCSISHNASLEQKCVYFRSEWCIVGNGSGALWDLWDWSIDLTCF